MKKRWMLAGGTVAVLAAVGGAWMGGLVKLPGSDAAASSQASAQTSGKGGDKKGDAKKDVPLEFVAREVVQPQMARLADVVEFSGPLVAPGTAIVRAKTGGTLLALTVGEGSRVAAGQPLGRLDLAELGTRVAERNANVESARAALLQAERTHASNQGLAQQQFISSIALENSRIAVETARAQLAAAQASLETTRVTVRDAALVAPISGIVAKRSVVPGERLAPEQAILTIVDLATLELAGSVGTHEVARLAPGMPVKVQVEGMAAPVDGKLARIAPAAEPGTRSIGVTIALANPKEQLRAGQYALARVVLADDRDRLTLPTAAVGNASGQDHVWLIENGVLARRSVQLGRRDDREGRVEVLAGVQPSSTVLAAAKPDANA